MIGSESVCAVGAGDVGVCGARFCGAPFCRTGLCSAGFLVTTVCSVGLSPPAKQDAASSGDTRSERRADGLS